VEGVAQAILSGWHCQKWTKQKDSYWLGPCKSTTVCPNNEEVDASQKQ
jgi:hypothetical protein